MVGDGETNLDLEGNSHNLENITGQLYHLPEPNGWPDAVWAISGTDELPVLRFQLPTPSPTASSTASITSSPSSTSTPSRTASRTMTDTPSRTPTRTRTRTPTTTGTTSNTPTGSTSCTSTGTPTETTTLTQTSTSTGTPTSTRTVTSTPTGTPTGTSSRSPTSTSTRTPSQTSTRTVTLTSTGTASETDSRTPTSTLSRTTSQTSTRRLTSTPTGTGSETSLRTVTPTSSRTPSETGTRTSTVTSTGAASETSTRTITLTLTATPSTTVTATLTQTPAKTTTSTASNTPTTTETRTSASTCTSSRTTTPTPSGTPSMTITGTSTTSLTSSPTGIRSGTVSSSISPTSSMTPSVSATISSTSSLGAVAGAESLSSGSSRSSGSRISSALRIFVPATLAVALAMLIMYLGYRRRRNEAEAKASSDPRAMYATQLGIPLESFKLMSSLEAGSGTLGHTSSVQPQGASLIAEKGHKQSMRQHPEGSQVYATDPVGEMKLAHINPLASGAQKSRAEQTESKSTKQIVADRFALKVGKTDRRNIKSYGVSGIQSGTESAVFSVGSMVAGAEGKVQNEARVVLVDPRAQSCTSSGSVRIVSTKAPKLECGQKNSSGAGKARLQVAVAADVDTTQLRRLDRARLKLRHWKARLLAEPPPLVQVETGATMTSAKDAEDTCKWPAHRSASGNYASTPSFSDAHIRRLEFSSSRPGASSLGGGLSRETKQHHQSQLRLEDAPLKKHFAPQIPRSKRSLSLY
eukprot:gb/GECG01013080.1/.p1 GENE.gb/GECG01013080.1/~~gb/GECG01013080.1/.p1  ORF type:complete len:751 (+),score=80.97 gb/GECG01013080.1/:1-2253(+)